MFNGRSFQVGNLVAIARIVPVGVLVAGFYPSMVDVPRGGAVVVAVVAAAWRCLR